MEKKKKNSSITVVKERRSSKALFEKDALKRIENNVKKIYDDAIVQKAVYRAIYRLKISSKLYDSCKNEVAKITDIHELIKFLTEKWIEQTLVNKKIARILSKRAAEDYIKRDRLDKNLDKNEIKYIVKNVSKIEKTTFLKHQITNYMFSDSFLSLPARVNFKIWGSVVDAMLFDIPEKKVLECKKSILEKNYLPTIIVNNNSLLISINELTTQDDLQLIWDDVEKRQEEHKNQHQYINSERGYANLKTDRIIMTLYDQKLKPKTISNKLKDMGMEEFTPKKVSERIKERKKQTRRDKDFFRF